MREDANDLIELAAKTLDEQLRHNIVIMAYRKRLESATSDDEVRLYKRLIELEMKILAQLKKTKEVVSVPKHIVR